MTFTVIDRVASRRFLPSPAMRRELRERVGASQAEVAALFSPPVTAQAVSLWERGTREPRGDNAAQYLSVLKMLHDLAEAS